MYTEFTKKKLFEQLTLAVAHSACCCPASGEVLISEWDVTWRTVKVHSQTFTKKKSSVAFWREFNTRPSCLYWMLLNGTRLSLRRWVSVSTQKSLKKSCTSLAGSGRTHTKNKTVKKQKHDLQETQNFFNINAKVKYIRAPPTHCLTDRRSF